MVSVLSLVALVAGSGGIAAAAAAHGGHGAPAGGFQRRGEFHGDFHGHPGFRRGFHSRVFVGAPFVWNPFPVYVPPPVVVAPPAVEAPPVYTQPAPSGYWYYCPSAGAYYPNVSSCPEPWVPVPASGG